jgi:Asp-tRNA(Asn)/Glu-tRNA(Gln) amidotransferase A subunit family amidase
LKPTFGRVSTRGVVPLSWTLDHVGPMTRRVRDAALMLQSLASIADVGGALETGAALRLGTPRALFFEGLHPEIESATNEALGVLERLGARMLDVTLDPGNEASVTVLRAEAWAYHEPKVARDPELYQPETLRRIRGGAEITAPEYIRARQRLDELRGNARSLFEELDLLVTPTTPVPPPAIDTLLADAGELRAKEFVMLRNTRPFNTLGLPTVSVPCGFTSAGLPIGLQLTGAPGDEARVLALAHAYEQATEWHARRPALA